MNSSTPDQTTRPSSVLFVCGMNAIRSPMAEFLTKKMYGKEIFAQSAGVHAGEADGFMQQAMDEIGIDISDHIPKSFDEYADTSFDMVISLSPEAHHTAIELTRTNSLEAFYWATFDPADASGSREQILDAYRSVRDALLQKIKQRFVVATAPNV
ncbi:MAG: protein-tyrosine-phosphatase [Rhizobiaceae bacterium]|nr:protein-tyrosine-phosphatase [Rhizobiaceae bacterium]